MKKCDGLIPADNGSSWCISGAPDSRWNNDNLATLGNVRCGSNLEVVDATVLMVDPVQVPPTAASAARRRPRRRCPTWFRAPRRPPPVHWPLYAPGDFDGDRKTDVTSTAHRRQLVSAARSSGTTQTPRLGTPG